jgi:hypothetical protein
MILRNRPPLSNRPLDPETILRRARWQHGWLLVGIRRARQPLDPNGILGPLEQLEPTPTHTRLLAEPNMAFITAPARREGATSA